MDYFPHIKAIGFQDHFFITYLYIIIIFFLSRNPRDAVAARCQVRKKIVILKSPATSKFMLDDILTGTNHLLDFKNS